MAMQRMFLQEVPHGAHMQAQHPGRARRHEDANAAFRSALLEEFRNSKDRKWTLKVSALAPYADDCS